MPPHPERYLRPREEWDHPERGAAGPDGRALDPFEDEYFPDESAEADEWDSPTIRMAQKTLIRDARRGLVSSQARRRAEDGGRSTVWDRISHGVL